MPETPVVPLRKGDKEEPDLDLTVVRLESLTYATCPATPLQLRLPVLVRTRTFSVAL
jgi:hypothetical protein